MGLKIGLSTSVFLSTLSLRRATDDEITIHNKKQFLSTLSLRRATSWSTLRKPCWTNFYPRSPCGERRQMVQIAGIGLLFLSTLSLRRATASIVSAVSVNQISIHALLAESDEYSDDGVSARKISIHALLAESDGRRGPHLAHRRDFYPRSPCGERRHQQTAHAGAGVISIHALLAESDRHIFNSIKCK